MKVVAISDTHNREFELPEGDLLIVAGDVSKTGTASQITSFNAFLAAHRHRFAHKPIVIAGNHDFLFQQNLDLARSLLTEAIYIEDELVEIDGIRIYGSPWTPTFGYWAFMKNRGEEIRQVWEQIPDGLDILITHGPPMGILDYCGKHAGCLDLLNVVAGRLARPPRYHVFGHIHEGHGRLIRGNTHYLNVSICDEHYMAINPVTEFEV